MGKDLFNISIFQKLSSCRIDDFLFRQLEGSMVGAGCIWEDLRIELELGKDYERLSGLTEASQPRELFYPKCRNLAAVDENSPRFPGFLSHLDDQTYFSFYEYLVNNGHQLSFPNPQEVLKNINTHCKTMQLVMTHVVMWLNDDPAKVNHRESNKPPLVDDLIPSMSPKMSISVSVYARETAKEKSLRLQYEVLSCIQEHTASLTNTANKEYLNMMSDENMDPLVYRGRFRAGPWRDVLVRVHKTVGSRFQNPCVANFNTAALDDLPGSPRISLVDSLQRVVVQHPEVAQDRALNNPGAIETLRVMVEEVVARWAAKQHEQAIFDKRPNGGMLAEAVARSDLARFRSASRSIASCAGPVPVPVPVPEHRPNIVPSPVHSPGHSPVHSLSPAADPPRCRFPWNRPDASGPERGLTSSRGLRSISSGDLADVLRISDQLLPSSVPTDSSPSSNSPQRGAQQGGFIHEEDENPQARPWPKSSSIIFPSFSIVFPSS
jgi:hypothetical protein